MKHFTSFALAGLVLALSAPAAASTTFPEALRKQLGLEQIAYPPLGCQLCHKDDLGGYKNATKPFGRALLKAGAAGGSVPSLLSALAALEAAGTDSDHDGSDDISELEAGTDPNVAVSSDGSPTPTFDDVPLPETGCTLSKATTQGSAWVPLLLAASLLWRRRSRRRG